MRIKTRFSPWFDSDLAELLYLKNSIWRKAWLLRIPASVSRISSYQRDKDATIAFDSKQYCAAICIDLAKAFDTVDYSILVGRLTSIGVSEGVFGVVC
jgi:hypothetical protein